MKNSITFLFTDLEGSTRLWQDFPEEMKNTLARHDEIVQAAIEHYNGQVVKTTGDGFHAAFSSVFDGLNASFHAQQNLAEETWDVTGPLRVRMGLHLGEAQQRGGDYYGTTVNRAARLMSAAHGGQVLLSAAVAELVLDQMPEGISLLDLGEHRLKDLQHPEHIFQLVHPALLSDFPAITSLNRINNNLPLQPTVFVGRENELREINNLMMSDSVRLLTLLGPGGTGKTRLALQSVAELIDQFTDGTYFIDLALIDDPNSILAAIARTIELAESSDGTILEDLKAQLANKSMLLLLDNFEQVTVGAVHVADLIQHCPKLKVLATSREALRIRGERLYPVPPLGLPEPDKMQSTLDEIAQYEAVQLFIERAQAVRPNFSLSSENAEIIAEICLRLDGLPLAIELAAARIRLFSPDALHQRLGNRFKLLQGGARDMPERQKTLRNAIDWSFDLLENSEKLLFEVVSVFYGANFETIESVANSIELLAEKEIDITEGLFSLVDKSLIRMLDDGVGDPRLRMLETIKEYATERLQLNPDLHSAACRAHAIYFADFAHRQWGRMTGYDREPAIFEMGTDVENLKIAWRYWAAEGNFEQLQKMVNSLWLLYDIKGWYQATVDLTMDLLEILSATASTPEQIQQEIMLQTSLARALNAIKGFTPEVEEAYTKALKLSEGQGEIPQLFPVLRGLSSYYMYRTEFDKGANIGERILALADSRDDNILRIHGYLVLGANTGFLGDFRSGLELLENGIELFEKEKHSLRPYQLGNNPGVVCYTTSAIFLFFTGLLDSAVKKADRAMELVETLNHPFTLAYTLFHTGNLHLWRGEIKIANERAQAMLTVAQYHGFQIWESLAKMLLGLTQVALSQLEEGLATLEQGFVSYQGHKTPPVFYPQIIGMRASAYALTGSPEKGLQMLDDLLQEYGEERVLREQPQLLLLRGDLLVAASEENVSEAFNLYETLLAGAIQAGSNLMALQAATRLAKKETWAGKRDAHIKLLREIYHSFTEGFETVDLIAAREVMDGSQV